jgi:hypothetical protein
MSTAFLLASVLLSAGPWYENKDCIAALEQVLAIDFDGAEPKIRAFEKSRDTDDQACGVWLRVSLAEAQLAVGGRLPALLDNRERMLKRMYGFSKAKRGVAVRFADLEIEARLRRVRVLLDKEDRGEALKEIRYADELREKRGEKDMNATLRYSRGVTNMAVGGSSFALRTVMRLAGVKGDADVGRADLRALEQSGTVYKYDALYLQAYFAGEDGASVYSGRLAAAFPTNPQFGYEHALHLYREKKVEQAFGVATRYALELEKKPAAYSNQVRASLFWISGRCAKDLGKRELAERYRALAVAQKFPPLEDEIEDLSED